MLQRFITHHVLVNLGFVLVLGMGLYSYLNMPREKDPTINFNWIQIMTFMPGASAEDVEQRITDPLEEEIRKISDIRFVSSTSREGLSNILVRFQDVEERLFDKRLTDLRREVQNKAEDELPEEAESPYFFEVTSDNALPSAILVVTGQADDENLRRQARNVRKDLERLPGVDEVQKVGLYDPELQVHFRPDAMQGLGVTAVDISNTVAAHFRDVSAGSVRLENEEWLVRLVGTGTDPGVLGRLPIVGIEGEVRIDDVAEVVRGREKANYLVRHHGKPAVMLMVTKKASANTLELVERLTAYLDERNLFKRQTGVDLSLLDDQTVSTRKAIDTMQKNALIGLSMVLLVTWLFLGLRIALLTSIGIPFILAGTFTVLAALGHSVNNSVLLGAVITLGMLVDDAVVVVESIHQRMVQGVEALQASLESLREVALPVTTAVLTTMAAFLPLMLLPGILGKFMLVIPLVVTIALAISLVEAFWMLPAHVTAFRARVREEHRENHWRVNMTRWLQTRYIRQLIRVLRHPWLSLLTVIALLGAAISTLALGGVQMNFFASDPLRLFYINVEMPPGTAVSTTLKQVQAAEARLLETARPGELRGTVAYAGQMFTETEPLYGSHIGQVFVSLNPKNGDVREVDDILDEVRPVLTSMSGAKRLSILRLTDGPPTEKPIKVKVRGDDFQKIGRAATAIKQVLADTPGVKDIGDDNNPGSLELALELNHDAVHRAGLSPDHVGRILRLLVDGEVVANLHDEGDKLEVRVRARPGKLRDIQAVLNHSVALPGGERIPLGELVHHRTRVGKNNIRHYNYRRTITVDADIDTDANDTISANEAVRAAWLELAADHPSIDLDFSGQLDDIYEALDALPYLFLFGLGLIYVILGTQFRSYFQPFMILVSVLLAFMGVVFGLLVTRNPMSLYTLYGTVALVGISVNAAIVLISAANQRLDQGMTVLHATLYAARRRVIPIIITTFTTIAGLFSLATGLAGKSLIWGPVATAIVWGLGFSALLTMFVIPLLYRIFMRWSHRAVYAPRSHHLDV